MKKYTNTGKFLIPLATILILLVLWEGVVQTFKVPAYTIPAPSAIILTLAGQLPLIAAHSGVTLYTALSGFLLAVVGAFAVALLTDSVPLIRKAIYPLMVISQSIPLIFIYPLIMMWMGFGIAPRILVVIIVCLFPVAVNLVDGLARTDAEYLDLFRSMGAGSHQTFLFLKLPGALPSFFSGLKISATYCIMGAVIAEWMGADKGIGIYMLRSYKTFAYERVYASIFTAVILSLIIFGLILILERISLSWKFLKNGETQS